MIRGEAGVDLRGLSFGHRGSEQARQHRPGLIVTTLDDQPPRAFGDEQQGDEVNRCRDRLEPEHPPPGRIPQPQLGGRAAGVAGEREVGDERPGKAGDDHDLLDARQPSADLGGRYLRDVDRRDHAGRAHPQSTDDPGDDKHRRAIGGPRQERADQEQDRGQHHDLAPTDRVREPTRAKSADRRPQQDRPDVDADTELTQIESGLKTLLGAVDHARIVSEHEPADRRDGHDQSDEPQIGFFARSHPLPLTLVPECPGVYSPGQQVPTKCQ